MTVSYTARVANSNHFGCFLKLLFRWRGSIYKLVWPDLFVFLSAFFSLSVVYRFFLDADQQRTFEKIAVYCEKYGTLIPVSFVLGFYVSIVIGRWWQQFRSIPWIDTLAIWVNSNIRGDEEKDRILRRTIMRYACLSITISFTLISPRVKKRFPTLDHLVEGGLLLESEKDIISEIGITADTGAKYSTFFTPLVWAASIVTRARAENKIKNDSVVKSLLDEINKIKDNCHLLLNYDWISVPLVYTQVVTLAVYMYFFSCIMGKQWVKNVSGAKDSEAYGKMGVDGLDLFFPIFTVLQFFFYMGWLKVAESLLNPFGDDDDDFELNWIVDRNLQVAYLIVDEMHRQAPELLRDQYWEQVVPAELPHTIASEQYKEEPPLNSTAGVTVTREEGEILPSTSLRSNLHLSSNPNFQDGALIGTPGSKGRGSIMRSRFASARSNSNQSQVTNVGSTSKLNRIGSVFKRMISRERKPSGSAGEEGDVFGSLIRIPGSKESAIPELDENMVTIVSTNRAGQVKPPTVQEIFGGRETALTTATVEVENSRKSPPPTSFDSMTVKSPEDKDMEEVEKDPLADVDTICISSGKIDV